MRIMTVVNNVAIFRCFTNMTIYILRDKEDNKLVLAMMLAAVHECFDKIFKRNNKKEISNK